MRADATEACSRGRAATTPPSRGAPVHFRDATPADIPDIVDAVDGAHGPGVTPRLRAVLPSLLRQLIADTASPVVVFEGDLDAGRIFAWTATLFVRPAVIDAYLAAPRAGLAANVLESMLDGECPLMDLDGLRRANAAGGVHLVLVPIVCGRLPSTHSVLAELRRLATLSFVQSVAGFRVAAVYQEASDGAAAAYLEQGGYRLLHEFATSDAAGLPWREAKPRMLRLLPADLPSGPMTYAGQLFAPPPPRLKLSPAEQRVALKALGGVPDRQIASVLGISPETVRSHWESIYARLALVLPEFGSPERDRQATRGREHRRAAVEYLRQHIHELRPHL